MEFRMLQRITLVLLVGVMLSALAVPVYAADTVTSFTDTGQDGSDTARPDGWTDETHGKSADPDYDVVFPDDAVNRIDIVIDPENWQAMLDDMTASYGEFGSRPEGMGGGRPGGDAGRLPPQGGQPPADAGQMPPAQGDFVPGGQIPGGDPPQGLPQDGFRQPGGAMPPGAGMDLVDSNPVWVPADVVFEGVTWAHVGIRFKGNSSLMSSWGSGSYKLPFKLDFDEFEDEFPEIDDQRFYGFKQLSLSSNFSDDSFLREKVTADIFREAGVPSAHTAFYRVYVDYGEGPVYFGLYTVVEVVDDTVIETQFDDDSGNVYKPAGTGATFAEGSFNEESFDKETNQDEDDYSDVLALYAALHDDTRLTDPAAWRRSLEAVFNVDGFVRWLAVNTVVQNWDTYGAMSHNYYLYTDPTTGLINWIPWDNNMALQAGMGGGGRAGGGGRMGSVLALDLEDVGSDWPLIRYIMDDPVYHALYVEYVDETINSAFEPEKMQATYERLAALVAPYVVGEQGEQAGYTTLSSPQAFEQALSVLIQHVNDRYAAASEYVASQSS